jgi:hypothetical protein
VVDQRDGIARAVDLNPRWQGSTALQAQAQRRSSVLLPLPALALLYSIGLLSAPEIMRARDAHFSPIQGAQVRIRSAEPRTVSIPNPPRPGVYTNTGKWVRRGLLLEQAGPDEVLLTGAPPRPGMLVETGSQLYRVYTPGSVLNAEGQPAEWIRRLIASINTTSGSSELPESP